MALADAQLVEKEELRDALSKKEGADTMSPNEALETAAQELDPDPEVLDPELRRFLEASDSDEAAQGTYPEREAGADSGTEEETENGGDHRGELKRQRQGIGGIVSTYRHNPELHESLGHQRTNKTLERLQHDFAAKVQVADAAKIALDNEEQRLRQLRKQAAAGHIDDPALLSYQESEVKKAWDRLTVVEKDRDSAELALLKVSTAGMTSVSKAKKEHKSAKKIARERHVDQIRRAKVDIAKDAYERDQEDAIIEAYLADQQRRDQEAEIHQQKGRRRLKEAQSGQKAVKQMAEDIREESRDAILLKIRSQNERREKKQQKVKEQREQHRRALLQDGKNPYEVWRREEMKERKEEQRLRMQAQAELRSEKLMEQLIIEDGTYKHKIQEEKRKREQADEFQRQVGNYAKEQKITQYMRKMTIGNVDVLDPTGTALRIDPSKVSIQKSNAFGLGRARTEEIQRVEQQVRTGNRRIEQWKEAQLPNEEEELAEALRLEQEQQLQQETFLRSASGDEPEMDEEEEEVDEDEEEFDEDEDLVEQKLWVPNYSKLEMQYMAAARERQRKNICSVQTWQGKEFKGDAFLAKPAVIAFNDFEVGKRYRQVIEVTNVSLTFNQFKLLPLDDSVKDFFEINFVPPGRMSAGVTRYITLWFVPKVSQDIVSTFPILAKTGRIDFPLRCTTKKTILTITPQDPEANPVIDFGAVLVGESADRELVIKNTGALSADFNVLRSESGEQDEQLTDMMTWLEKGICKSLGSTKIGFKFVPTTLGEFTTDLRLRISNGAPGDANYEKEFCIRVRGSCLDVPIYVDSEEYDMHTCVYGHIFRESVMIRNRGSVAMKIQVQKPTQIEGELQLNTALAYIQGYASQAIQVKLIPKADFLDRHPEFRDAQRPDVPGAFRIPMRIIGADQVLPVNTCLIGTLTTDAMTFLPGELNFGPCLVGTSAVQRLIIVNESSLKRRYAFTRLPSHLSVQEVPEDVLQEEAWGGLDAKPGTIAVVDAQIDGVLGSLLPGEKRQVSVLYTPESAIEMDCKILCKVITGDLCVRDFVIHCTGQGISSSLEFSETQLDLASIPADAATKDSIVVRNVSKVPQMLNALLPPFELSGLKMTPICFTLQPKESQRLQVEFKPTKEYVDLLKMPVEEKPEAPEDGAAAPPDGEEAPAEEPGEMDAEEYSRHQMEDIREHGGRRWDAEGTVHGSWRLPICFKTASQGMREGRDQFCYLSVNTCVLPSVLAMQPPILDFGDVTAGQRALRPLVITNLAAEEGAQELQLEALPENQGFTVLNAPRAVGSKPFQFMVEFKPQLVQIYQCSLQMRTQNTRVQVPLRGKGVSPVLKIEPQDGVIHMGAVIYNREAKDYTTQQFLVKNESPFELVFKLETIIPADANHHGDPPFTASPSSGTVEANSSMPVTITFRPHRPNTIFREKILVNVPNQREPTYVYLYGHCFKYQAYGLMGMDFMPFGRQDAKPKAAFVDSLAVGTCSGFSAGGTFEYPPAQTKEFSLVFERGENLKNLMIGACVPPGTPTAPQEKGVPAVTYDFQILPGEHASLFSVEVPEGQGKPDKQAKGNLQPGKPAVKVAFRYNPPAEAALVFGGVSLDHLNGIGQWITCKAKGVLGGGFVPPGETPTQELTVELRAYLQQI